MSTPCRFVGRTVWLPTAITCSLDLYTQAEMAQRQLEGCAGLGQVEAADKREHDQEQDSLGDGFHGVPPGWICWGHYDTGVTTGLLPEDPGGGRLLRICDKNVKFLIELCAMLQIC